MRQLGQPAVAASIMLPKRFHEGTIDRLTLAGRRREMDEMFAAYLVRWMHAMDQFTDPPFASSLQAKGNKHAPLQYPRSQRSPSPQKFSPNVCNFVPPLRPAFEDGA